MQLMGLVSILMTLTETLKKQNTILMVFTTTMTMVGFSLSNFIKFGQDLFQSQMSNCIHNAIDMKNVIMMAKTRIYF